MWYFLLDSSETYTYVHMRACTHTHSPPHTHKHTLTYKYTNTLTHSLTHTNTNPYTHKHTHSHTPTQRERINNNYSKKWILCRSQKEGMEFQHVEIVTEVCHNYSYCIMCVIQSLILVMVGKYRRNGRTSQSSFSFESLFMRDLKAEH